MELTSQYKQTENTGEAIYLYCLAHADFLSSVEGTGVDERYSITLLRRHDIVAVWSKVSLDDFCGVTAPSRLKDISWVGPRACRHEKVVKQIMSQSPVLPTRFGTIFSSFAGLEKLLEKHHDEVLEFLSQVSEREEWSVKGFLDRDRAREELLSLEFSKQKKRLALLSPGKCYIQEKQIRKAVEQELNTWLQEMCNGIAESLNRSAADFSERTVLSRNATGMDMDMILNWAFLVPQEVTAAFHTLIDKANKDHDCHGLMFVLSGPWPPYSFSPTLDTPT